MANQKQKVPANAIHPGEILREEYMVPLGLTSYRLAAELKISVPRVNEIVRERRAITADTALRLAAYFETTPEFWMNLQTNFELDAARAKKSVTGIKPRRSAA
jgi:addiction module HigA family antidote